MALKLKNIAMTAGLILLEAVSANAGQIKFSITNTTPGTDGMWLMRPWVGISNGNFATYTVGQTASKPVIHLAEDGVTGDISAGASNLFGPGNACTGVSGVYAGDGSDCLYNVFNNTSGTYSQTSIGGPTKQGQTLTGTLAADPKAANSQFLSFLVMAIPSNDTFFGTQTGQAIQLFNGGVFTGINGHLMLQVHASDLLDAGAESDPSAGAIAFLGQTVAGQGVQNSPLHVITQFTAYNSTIVNGSNGFGGTTNTFENINNIFGQNAGNPVIATIDISYSDAPEPATFMLVGGGVLAAGLFGRRRQK